MKIKFKRSNKDKHETETQPFKKKAHRLLAIILKKNSGTKFLWIKPDLKGFTKDKNYYYINKDGVYITDNNTSVSVYIEGVSLPIGHCNLETETKTVEYTETLTGKKKTRKITVIKTLKFDSELLDMLLNEDLASDFIKNKLDMPNLIIILMLAGSVILNIINICMWFT